MMRPKHHYSYSIKDNPIQFQNHPIFKSQKFDMDFEFSKTHILLLEVSSKDKAVIRMPNFLEFQFRVILNIYSIWDNLSCLGGL